MKFTILDWAGNTMNWGEFDSIDDADCELDARTNEEIYAMGLNLDLISSCGLDSEYPILANAIDKIVTEFRGEYQIVEVK